MDLAKTKRGPNRHVERCSWCGGSGQRPANPRDRRAGTVVCHRCQGRGEYQT